MSNGADMAERKNKGLLSTNNTHCTYNLTYSSSLQAVYRPTVHNHLLCVYKVTFFNLSMFISALLSLFISSN